MEPEVYKYTVEGEDPRRRSRRGPQGPVDTRDVRRQAQTPGGPDPDPPTRGRVARGPKDPTPVSKDLPHSTHPRPVYPKV